MTTKDVNQWIMYHEIKKLSSLGFKTSQIARYLGMDPRTVKKYLAMHESAFENHLIQQQQRSKVLAPFEHYVFEKLSKYQDTTTAQMFDWLKEDFPESFPQTTSRTVYNFVMYVRQKYNIPVQSMPRQYMAVPESPYGEQAQVDFGVYNMRTVSGKRKKVWFFVMVLSRSRMKYAFFSQKPFTAESVCRAHELSFAFFGGIPCIIVYDQDRTMVVDENIGDVILTQSFRQYVQARSFKQHFCRKADPESKGKVENSVKYFKQNFLHNRLYVDIETLNSQAIGWLDRTANALEHNYTKKIPAEVFLIERQHLNPYSPMTLSTQQETTYNVLKTNVINYKSNYYQLPLGTYKGAETKVAVKRRDKFIDIYTLKGELICSHELASGKGQTVTKTNFRRDTSKSIQKLTDEVKAGFSDVDKAGEYLKGVKSRYGRYIRDHLQAIRKVIDHYKNRAVADQTLSLCLKNHVFNGNEFVEAYHVLLGEEKNTETRQDDIKILYQDNLDRAEERPDKSDLDEYESAFKS